MTNKRWIICFLVMSLVALVAFAGIMYVTDPLIRYGKENGLFTCYEYQEMYSNPGIVRNYKYDTVLVGTSMIQNTDVQECNSLFGCDMVRLPYSSGTCYNMKTILDVCFERDNTIKTVYWELDEFQLFSAHAKIENQSSRQSHILFKIAVELGIINHMLVAGYVNLSDSEMRYIRNQCTNIMRKSCGFILFENALATERRMSEEE